MFNQRYWKSKATLIAFLLGFLLLISHLMTLLSLDKFGGKQTVGFFFFSPYMNWLPVDISSNLFVVWSMAAPLLSVLAGGMFAAFEGRKGFSKMLRTRLSFTAYRRKTLLAGGFWGALLPIFLLTVDFLMQFLIQPNVAPNAWLNNNVAISYLGFFGAFFYAHSGWYVVGWILLAGVYGASYAIFSNYLYFETKKMTISLLGVMVLQLMLLGLSMILGQSLAPIGYMQVVPTIGQPSLAYVFLWPLGFIALSLLAFHRPAVEV